MTSGRYTPNLGNNSSYSNGKMVQELDKIKVALDNTLSRYADQPNQMESDLDMNSNQILNLLDAVDLSEPATYRQLLAGLGGTTPVYNSEEVAVQGQLEYQLPITDSEDAKDYWVYVGGVRQAPDTDYTIDLPNGKLVFVEQPPAGETILSFGFRPNVKFVDGNIQIPVLREKQTVQSNGQLDFTFNLDLTRSTVHVTGSGVDDGQKFEGVHYKLTSGNSLQFFESYPIGTQILLGVPTNEGASSLGALVFGDIELAKGANVQDGTLIRVPSRGNAEYIVEPSTYTPVAVGRHDHLMGTGQYLRLNYSSVLKAVWLMSEGENVYDVFSGWQIPSGTTLTFEGLRNVTLSYSGAIVKPYGTRAIDVSGLEDVTLDGAGVTVSTVNHDIATNGGLVFVKGEGVKGFEAFGFDFDMTFQGTNTSSDNYPQCGAFYIRDAETATGTNTDPMRDIYIHDNTFKLFHPDGSFRQSSAPFDGDQNNGFKIYSITVLGDYLAQVEANRCKNFTAERNTFKKGHNAYGIWGWAVDNTNFIGNVAESWVTKYTLSSGAYGGNGVPFLRYHQFYANGLNVHNNVFRAKPSDERTLGSGFEGSGNFLNVSQNLTNMDNPTTKVSVTGNTIECASGYYEAGALLENTLDYGVGVYAGCPISVTGNTFITSGVSVTGGGGAMIYCFPNTRGLELTASGNTMTGSGYSHFCLLSSSADTAENRPVKSVTLVGNTVTAFYQYFFAQLGTGTASGVEKLLISGNLIDGVGSYFDYVTSGNVRAIALNGNVATDTATLIGNSFYRCSHGILSTTGAYSGKVNQAYNYAEDLIQVGTLWKSLEWHCPTEIGSYEPEWNADGGIVAKYQAHGGTSTMKHTLQTTTQYTICSHTYRVYVNNAAHTVFEGTNFRPDLDNVLTLGAAAQRWSTVYAATGTINTSDERTKTTLVDVEQAEVNCALECKQAIKKFRFLDAVETKGDSARIHFGVGAQTVKSIFESHGLDPAKYGLFCYDQWDAEYDEDGNETLAAGDRYGIRYDELAMFILAAI